MSNKHKNSRNSTGRAKSTPRGRKKGFKPIWLGIALIVVSLAAAVFFLTRPETTPITEISPAQAYEKFQQGVYFLDVRSEEEYQQIHIPRAAQIPLDELESRLSEIPQDQEVVVVCLSGKRSKEGMTILQKAGFNRVYCMSDGISAWKSAGYPVEGDSL